MLRPSQLARLTGNLEVDDAVGGVETQNLPACSQLWPCPWSLSAPLSR